MHVFNISAVVTAVLIAGVLGNVHRSTTTPAPSTFVGAQIETDSASTPEGDSNALYALYGYRTVLLHAYARDTQPIESIPAIPVQATTATISSQNRALERSLAYASMGDPDAVIARHFPLPLQAVMKVIAYCESRFTAVVNAAGDRGWFQIAMVHFNQPWMLSLVASMAGPTISVEDALLNPDINAAAAAHLAQVRPDLGDWAGTVGGC